MGIFPPGEIWVFRLHLKYILCNRVLSLCVYLSVEYRLIINSRITCISLCILYCYIG